MQCRRRIPYFLLVSIAVWVLILPGWKINRTGKGPVNVVNPRELPAGLFYFPEYPLSDRLVEKIEEAVTAKDNDPEWLDNRPVSLNPG